MKGFFCTQSSAVCYAIFLGFYPISHELFETAAIWTLKGASKTLRAHGWRISRALGLAWCRARANSHGQAVPLGSTSVTSRRPSHGTVSGCSRGSGRYRPLTVGTHCVLRQQRVCSGKRLCWPYQLCRLVPLALTGIGLIPLALTDTGPLPLTLTDTGLIPLALTDTGPVPLTLIASRGSGEYDRQKEGSAGQGLG